MTLSLNDTAPFCEAMWKHGIRLAFLVGVACLLAACAPPLEPVPEESETPTATTDETPRRIFLISLDTLRADRLGAYGYSRPTSPFLDRLASEGVLFKLHFSQSVSTLQSHASVFLSRYLDVHGVTSGRRMTDSHVHLVETLRQSGFATAGFVSGNYVSAEFGFDRGYEVYETYRHDDSKIDERTLEWLQEEDPRPQFLFLHYTTPHAPFTEPNPYRESYGAGYEGIVDGRTETVVEISRARSELRSRLEDPDRRHLSDLYDDGVSHLDRHLERLFERLQADGFLDDALVIFFSDHGECLFDHKDQLEHGRLLYDELNRVPLLIWGPDHVKPRTVEALVESVDIMPTVFDFAGIDPALRPPMQGESLLPLIDGTEESGRPFVVSEAVSVGRFDRKMIRTKDWKLVVYFESEDVELYYLPDDPREQNNLAAQRPEQVASMKRDLADWIRSTQELAVVGEAEEAVLSQETEAQLRSLGYIQ